MILVRLAVRETVEENPAGLSIKEIAARMGVSLSLLYSWGDPDEAGADIPLKRLVQFTLITNDSRALAALANEAGHCTLPIPALGTIGEIEPESIKALHEFSEFMRENSRAFFDGVITAAELRRIEKEAYEAMLSISRVVAVARRQRQAGKKP